MKSESGFSLAMASQPFTVPKTRKRDPLKGSVQQRDPLGNSANHSGKK